MAKVLVVDDNRADRRIAVHHLEAAGLETAVADNGQRALEVIPYAEPDAILTDLVMPEMDGLGLVRAVRVAHPDLPVVLMTGNGSESLATTALKEGAASYIPKGALASELRGVIRTVLETTSYRRELDGVFDFLMSTHSTFSIGYEEAAPRALIRHYQHAIRCLGLCDDLDLHGVGTALSEALTNAIDHGNLELDSALREEPGDRYGDERRRRLSIAPYRARRVHVEMTLSRDAATCVVRDEGPGFDPASLPDPVDTDNLLKATGRGVFLLRTLMDEVEYSEKGNELKMVKRRAPSSTSRAA